MSSNTLTTLEPDLMLVSRKHKLATCFSIFLGWLGIDRMCTRRFGLGILKLITLGGVGIWWLVDFILIASGKAKDDRGIRLMAYDDGSYSDTKQGEAPPDHALVSRQHSNAVILSALLGWLGIDRMATGRIGLGILKLITLGGIGIWHIVDLYLMGLGKAKDGDGNPLIQYIRPTTPAQSAKPVRGAT